MRASKNRCMPTFRQDISGPFGSKILQPILDIGQKESTSNGPVLKIHTTEGQKKNCVIYKHIIHKNIYMSKTITIIF